jgi:cell division transport system permease protein
MGFIRFVAFSVVRAWQGFWRNAMMSLATTATVVLMLVLLSGLYIVITGLNSGLQFIESKVGVTARLVGPPEQPALTQSELDALLTYAQSLPGVKQVHYVSPDEALSRLAEVYREQGKKLVLDTSPEAKSRISIYASIEIQLTDPKMGDSVADTLSERPEVVQITTKQSDINKLVGIINVIRTVGLVAIALIGLAVLFMIINTIRYSRAN